MTRLVAKIVRLASGIASLIAVVAIAGAGVLSAESPIAAAPGVAVASERQPADALPITSSAPQLSAPVRDLEPAPTGATSPNDELSRINPLASDPDQGAAGTWDRTPSRQSSLQASGAQAQVRTPAPDLVFDGTANPFACGGCAPPDTTGDVGPDHYIQMVNSTKVAIYNKSGSLLRPAFDLSTLFTSGVCSTFNRGDPQVLYDPLANRWVLSQFTPRGTNTLCFAVSQTPDPLGAYYLYAFATPDFPDYFKVGVWPDGYYVSSNESTYTAYALDRAQMLVGLPATAVRVPGQTNMLLPADVDGPTPPTEIGGLFYTFKSKDYPAHGVSFDQLQVFRLTPDFATPPTPRSPRSRRFPSRPSPTRCAGTSTSNAYRSGTPHKKSTR